MAATTDPQPPAQGAGRTFRNVNLAHAVFDDVNLSQATFHNVNLAGSRFDDINFSDAELTHHCNVRGMRIDGMLVTELLELGRKQRSQG